MITLRALEDSDLDFLFALENDPTIWTVSDTLAPVSRYALREYLMNIINSQRRERRDSYDAMASKIFAAVQAHIEDRAVQKLQVGSVVLDTFRRLYSRGKAGQLVTEARAQRAAARRLAESYVPGTKQLTTIDI